MSQRVKIMILSLRSEFEFFNPLDNGFYNYSLNLYVIYQNKTKD